MPAILENLAELKQSFSQPSQKSDAKRQTTESPRDLVAEMSARVNLRIKKGLEFPHTKVSGKDDLVRVFTRDFESLSTHLAQWVGFIEELQRSSFSFAGLDLLSESQLAEVNSDVHSLFEKSKSFKFNDDKTLVDEVFEQEFQEMKSALGNQLDKSIGSFVTFVFGQLADLQSNNILGTIRFSSEESCSFVDWQHDVIAKKFEPRVVRSNEFERDNGFAVDRVRESVVKSGVVLTHSATRREQHLMKTEKSRLSEFQLKIPSQFNDLIAALPDVLRPEIRVVSGEAFRNEKKRHKFGEKDWTEQRVQTEVIERLRVYFDPAVTIGSTVLFAWDNEDSTADNKRQESLNKFIWACSCAAAAVIVFLMMTNQNVISRVLFASPIFAGGVWLAVTAFEDRMLHLGKKVTQQNRVQTGLGWLFVMLALCAAAASLVAFNVFGILMAAALMTGGIYLIKPAINQTRD